jgi:16S rRNA (adenine(1408)-N(1))-methyltransferase
MVDASRRGAAKLSRGGLANVLFLQASLESLPPLFEAIADQITINYPWGSLLRAVALPDVDLLSKLAAMAKRDGKVEIFINAHPFEDPAYTRRIGLAEASLVANRSAFTAVYAKAGLLVTEVVDASDNARATRWGKRLEHGSRRVLRIRATRS